MERFDKHASGALCGVDHAGCFDRIHGERFLAEHGLAGFERGDGEVGMDGAAAGHCR